jgi:hypothetical protein
LSRSRIRTQSRTRNYSLPSRSLFHPHFLTSMRSCNRHAPLLIQEGRARAGQYVQPLRVGQYPAPNSSEAREGGGGRNTFIRGGRVGMSYSLMQFIISHLVPRVGFIMDLWCICQHLHTHTIQRRRSLLNCPFSKAHSGLASSTRENQ